MNQPAQPPPPQAADRRLACPECGEPAEQGQELCLRCGARVGRTYRRPPGWRVPAALAALGILLIGAGAGFAVADLTHDDGKKEKTVVPLGTRTTTPAPSVPTTPPSTTTTTGADRGVKPVPGPGGSTGSTPPAGGKAPPTGGAGSAGAGAGGPTGTPWPKGVTAYTVALATTKTRAAAQAQLAKASKRDFPAGILRASDYVGLPGPWVVFSSQYRTSDDAKRAAIVFAKEGFPAATVRKVRPRH